jgi:hypothetical protein
MMVMSFNRYMTPVVWGPSGKNYRIRGKFKAGRCIICDEQGNYALGHGHVSCDWCCDNIDLDKVYNYDTGELRPKFMEHPKVIERMKMLRRYRLVSEQGVWWQNLTPEQERLLVEGTGFGVSMSSEAVVDREKCCICGESSCAHLAEGETGCGDDCVYCNPELQTETIAPFTNDEMAALMAAYPGRDLFFANKKIYDQMVELYPIEDRSAHFGIKDSIEPNQVSVWITGENVIWTKGDPLPKPEKKPDFKSEKCVEEPKSDVKPGQEPVFNGSGTFEVEVDGEVIRMPGIDSEDWIEGETVRYKKGDCRYVTTGYLWNPDNLPLEGEDIDNFILEDKFHGRIRYPIVTEEQKRWLFEYAKRFMMEKISIISVTRWRKVSKVDKSSK